MLGAVNILKPTGWTSSDVVVKVRQILRNHFNTKNVKVGHLGTLDPAGSGVLPIVFGNATKLFDYFQNGDKIYRTTFTFGSTTDTLDSFGKIIDNSTIIPNIGEITGVIKDFIGDIEQLPPKYSRISVDGIRACDASRKGRDIDLPTRNVKIFAIDILDYSNNVLSLDVHCSGGTYIRSLCRDLAERLNTVAYMSSIIRLENKGFKIENSVTIDEFKENVQGNLIDINTLLSDMKFIEIDESNAFKILNGVAVPSLNYKDDYVLTINGKVFGICKDEENKVKVLIRLWE